MMNGTGDFFNRWASANAIGATISTVATFSINADRKPERIETKRIATPRFLDLRTNTEAKYDGTPEMMNVSARINVPQNIPKTPQLIDFGISAGDSIPRATYKIAAAPKKYVFN